MSQIKRQVLVDALSQLKPGLSQKDIIESGQCFSFHSDHIVTFNDLMSVAVPLETGIEGAIKAEEFYKLLDKIKGEDLTLIKSENEIRISCGKVKAGLSVSSKVLPALEPENEFLLLPKGFKEAINLCQFSASRDMTRPHLTCVHIQDQFITSSDNYRITEMWMDEPSPYNFLLPADAVEHLLRYNLTHLSLDLSWAHFLDEITGVVFSCRLKAGDQMDVAKFFEVEGTTVKFPSDLKDTLERTNIMVEGDSNLDLNIKLRLETGKLICRGEKSIGWVEETVDIDYAGEPVDMLVNPLFLAQILSRTQEMIVNQEVCMFWGSNFRHLMMLISK